MTKRSTNTADVGFEVDGPTWPVLLERAALVVAAIIVALDGVVARETVRLAVTAGDREELLHDWLQAVLIRVQGGFVPCEVTVDASVRSSRLDAPGGAAASGAPPRARRGEGRHVVRLRGGGNGGRLRARVIDV